MSELSNFELRAIQAQVIRPIYVEMVKELGKEKTHEILEKAIQTSAREEAAAFAAQEPNGKTSMRSFIDLYNKRYKNWSSDCGLDVKVLRADDKHLDFDVTRCGYVELYNKMGLGHLTELLACNRDGTFCEGYDPHIKLERNETIPRGSNRCTFRYFYESDG